MVSEQNAGDKLDSSVDVIDYETEMANLIKYNNRFTKSMVTLDKT